MLPMSNPNLECRTPWVMNSSFLIPHPSFNDCKGTTSESQKQFRGKALNNH